MAKKLKNLLPPKWLEWIGKQTPNGAEIPDPQPMAIPVGARRPLQLDEQIRRLLRSEEFHASMAGDETFEEALDFDVDDEFDPSSPYEAEHDEQLGMEISPQMWAENRDKLIEMAKTRMRNQVRLEEQLLDLEEDYQSKRKPPAEPSGRGAPPTPKPKPE